MSEQGAWGQYIIVPQIFGGIEEEPSPVKTLELLLPSPRAPPTPRIFRHSYGPEMLSVTIIIILVERELSHTPYVSLSY